MYIVRARRGILHILCEAGADKTVVSAEFFMCAYDEMEIRKNRLKRRGVPERNLRYVSMTPN